MGVSCVGVTFTDIKGKGTLRKGVFLPGGIESSPLFLEDEFALSTILGIDCLNKELVFLHCDTAKILLKNNICRNDEMFIMFVIRATQHTNIIHIQR